MHLRYTAKEGVNRDWVLGKTDSPGAMPAVPNPLLQLDDLVLATGVGGQNSEVKGLVDLIDIPAAFPDAWETFLMPLEDASPSMTITLGDSDLPEFARGKSVYLRDVWAVFELADGVDFGSPTITLTLTPPAPAAAGSCAITAGALFGLHGARAQPSWSAFTRC